MVASPFLFPKGQPFRQIITIKNWILTIVRQCSFDAVKIICTSQHMNFMVLGQLIYHIPTDTGFRTFFGFTCIGRNKNFQSSCIHLILTSLISITPFCNQNHTVHHWASVREGRCNTNRCILPFFIGMARIG